MARYVNAEDVERLILENLDDLSELMKTAKGTDREKLFFKEMGLTDAIAHLYEAPTVDVREVNHCHIVHDKGGWLSCSNCHTLLPQLFDVYRYYYCPNCGAIIDEVVE